MTAIVCYSRCMWCGRRTPHEWCHECVALVRLGSRPYEWTGERFNMDEEVCDKSDGECEKARL